MKTLILILFSIFYSKGCNPQSQADLKDTVLEYTANTRGFYTKIVIQNQMITVQNNRDAKNNPVATKISDENWKSLLTEFQKVDLDKLSDYNDPTQKRFYDGAAFANLHIVYKEKSYDSKEFDHGFPPVEMEKLIKTILLIASKE
jgi:hypothetical protein